MFGCSATHFIGFCAFLMTVMCIKFKHILYIFFFYYDRFMKLAANEFRVHFIKADVSLWHLAPLEKTDSFGMEFHIEKLN